jgi:site-specific DNA recombinase
MKYFLYVRKSTEDKGKQITSIEDQILTMKQIAEREDIKIAKVFNESKSAYSPGRPEFNKMLQEMEKGKVEGILCWKLDRLARNPIDEGKIKWMLQQNIIKAIKTNDRIYLSQDHALISSVEFGMANQYSRDLSVNTKRGMKTKAERGWWPELAPLGYLNHKERIEEQSIIIKDPERYNSVRKIFDWFLNEHLSIAEIREKSYSIGLKTKKGKKLSKTIIYSILTKPFYYGYYEWQGKMIKGNHTPMITEEEYYKIQELLGRRTTKRINNHNFLYKGTMTCKNCGGAITASKIVKKQKNGNRHEYIYYHCGKSKDITCNQKSQAMREDKIDEQVLDILKDIQIPEDFYNWAMEEIKKENKIENENRKEILIRQQDAYNKACRKISNLIDMRANEEITKEQYEEKIKEAEKEKVYYKKILDNIDEKVDAFTNKVNDIFNFAKDAREKFKNGSPETKKKIFLNLGSNLQICDKKLLISLDFTLLPFQKHSDSIKNLNKRFKPLKNSEHKKKTEEFSSVSPILLPGSDSNRRPIG